VGEGAGTTAASPALHPLQQAWIDVQVPHCGYCQNGMMIQAADLLSTTKNPTEDQIRTAMNGHLCRCAPTGWRTAEGVLVGEQIDKVVGCTARSAGSAASATAR
jgi:aerobic-type carbon monoxide dehydrogenase small subunit (CoxS/CutS family)